MSGLSQFECGSGGARREDFWLNRGQADGVSIEEHRDATLGSGEVDEGGGGFGDVRGGGEIANHDGMGSRCVLVGPSGSEAGGLLNLAVFGDGSGIEDPGMDLARLDNELLAEGEATG